MMIEQLIARWANIRQQKDTGLSLVPVTKKKRDLMCFSFLKMVRK